MIKVFVIHVRGAIKREEHIKQELAKFNIDFEFILDGNKEDISTNQLNTYFSGDMYEVSAKTSCAIKHILAYEKIVEHDLDKALIFEDDILLRANFNEVLNTILEEIEREKLTNYFISLENSNHAYVNKSEIIQGKTLYKKVMGRCAGAYIVDYACAHSMLEEIRNHKCDQAIDWFHNTLSEKQKINMYWSHPFIAEQGSHNGTIPSLIDNKKTGLFRKMVYFFQREIKSRQEIPSKNR